MLARNITGLELRDYQQEAVDSVFRIWGEDPTSSPLIVLPTGAGKSVCVAELSRRFTQEHQKRVVCVIHVKELVRQNYAKFREHQPSIGVGIFSASLGRKDFGCRVTFANIQSIYRWAERFRNVGLLLIDEVHLVPHADDGMYRTFIRGLREVNPGLKICGLTATPWRTNSGNLCEPYGDQQPLFSEVAYELPMTELLRRDFLSPMRAAPKIRKMDTTGVHTRGGEFIDKELDAAVNTEEINKAIVAETVEVCRDRKSWLVFCVTIDHATRVRDLFRSHGITCEMVSGETERAERDRIIRDFGAGRIRCVTNVNVLATGYDNPNIDAIIMARPTKSPGMFLQQAGRGLRRSDAKQDCLAEGTLILTDHGLVEIQNVTTDMRVWDGVDFVRHHGPVCKGEQDVISYAGLTATPDHKVWTAQGWKSFGECAEQQIAIAKTGVGGTPIREADRLYRENSSDERPRRVDDAMRGLRRGKREALPVDHEGGRGLSEVRPAASRAEVALASVQLRNAEVSKSERQGMGEVRPEGHRVSLSIGAGYGDLGAGESWPGAGKGAGSHRQRPALRARQSSLVDPGAESGSHAKADDLSGASCVPHSAPGDQVCGRDPASDARRDDVAGSDRAVPPVLMQAKRRVWDILNAGPLHRFTAEGLLVSNCLLLDFAGNTRMHGWLTHVKGVHKKKRDEPEGRECPECATMNERGVESCVACGYVWPKGGGVPQDRESKLFKSQTTDRVMAAWEEGIEGEVVSAMCKPHVARSTGITTLQVEYTLRPTGGGEPFRVWQHVCIEHEGWANKQARAWWRQRSKSPPPATVAEAMMRLGELKLPKSLLVTRDGQWWRVESAKF